MNLQDGCWTYSCLSGGFKLLVSVQLIDLWERVWNWCVDIFSPVGTFECIQHKIKIALSNGLERETRLNL